MKKYEILVEDAKAAELTQLLEKLPSVKKVRQSEGVNIYLAASENTLRDDWDAEEDVELQKLNGK